MDTRYACGWLSMDALHAGHEILFWHYKIRKTATHDAWLEPLGEHDANIYALNTIMTLLVPTSHSPDSL